MSARTCISRSAACAQSGLVHCPYARRAPIDVFLLELRELELIDPPSLDGDSRGLVFAELERLVSASGRMALGEVDVAYVHSD